METLTLLPKDAPTDVLNEIQLVQEFYGADTPADHQRVMALFAPGATLDLPQMLVHGRDAISAVMFYSKRFLADVDIEPYMVEVSLGGSGGLGHHTHTTSTGAGGGANGGGPTSSTTSTDSTGSTCTSAATSRRRRPGGGGGSGKPPKAPSSGAAQQQLQQQQQQPRQPSRLGRGGSKGGAGPSSFATTVMQQLDAPPRGGRSRQLSDQTTTTTDQADRTAQAAAANNAAPTAPAAMSRTHVYAVATVTPKALARLLTLNLLPREFRLRTRVTLVWDDEAGEVLCLQERPDNLPSGLVPRALKRALGRLLGAASWRSQWLVGRLAATRLLGRRWPALQRLHGTGI